MSFQRLEEVFLLLNRGRWEKYWSFQQRRARLGPPAWEQVSWDSEAETTCREKQNRWALRETREGGQTKDSPGASWAQGWASWAQRWASRWLVLPLQPWHVEHSGNYTFFPSVQGVLASWEPRLFSGAYFSGSRQGIMFSK